ncbi:hypothetical protein LRS10_13730 [Phenylobacterium sp. J426]|uniref:hypothetical protein n=1 Tax=Phenylobacterium sp. J426 TaxID=2898439 RepID=UPI002151C531|nr:hypothetical protein [Phenylobacterium sp. J426]MCR5875154.1 hypothetical protein [Phenylobacterium sp. J426]
MDDLECLVATLTKFGKVVNDEEADQADQNGWRTHQHGCAEGGAGRHHRYVDWWCLQRHKIALIPGFKRQFVEHQGLGL